MTKIEELEERIKALEIKRCNHVFLIDYKTGRPSVYFNTGGRALHTCQLCGKRVYADNW